MISIYEDFVKIEGFSNYRINRDGTIVSFLKWRNNPYGIPHVIKPYTDRNGYLVVSLRNDNGAKKNQFVHLLVAKMFLQNPENLPYVNHKDLNRQNPSVDNLEWCTLHYNNSYSFSHGCEEQGCSCDLFFNGKFVDSFKSISAAAKHAVQHFKSDYNHLCNYLMDANVSIVRKAPSINIYHVYVNADIVYSARYFKNCIAFVKERFGVSLDKSRKYSVTKRIAIIKNNEIDINDFWIEHKRDHNHSVSFSWEVLYEGESQGLFEGLNAAINWIKSHDNTICERSIRRNHQDGHYQVINRGFVE